MSQQQLLQFVTGLLPSWRKTRRTVLAVGAHGLLTRRRLTLCGIARGLVSRARVLRRVKRIWRFLDNAALDPREPVSMHHTRYNLELLAADLRCGDCIFLRGRISCSRLPLRGCVCLVSMSEVVSSWGGGSVDALTFPHSVTLEPAAQADLATSARMRGRASAT